MGSILTTRLVEGDLARLELEAAELRVVAGPDRGTRHALGSSSVLIGSGRDCELVLHDSSVSARHAEVVATTQGYVLRDLQSTNGVLLGKHRVERLPLAHGLRLTLGESTLAVRALGDLLKVPLEQPGRFGSLVAHSIKMRALVAMLQRLAGADTTALIEGETGTGKELVAEALHTASDRRHAPFVVFDCVGISRSMIAAELFGHERGAFTGAVEARAGIYEQADGGTLFLDEVGELPLDLQPMLLAALERKTTRRIGGKRAITHDVRIVAATNRNLAEEVRAGRFREDLFHRLAVARVRVPPLRERPEDLPILAEAFAREIGLALSPELLVPLKAYDWPGNVRELRNTIQRIAIQPEEASRLRGRPLRPADGGGAGALDLMFDEGGRLRPLRDARRAIVDAFERRYVEQVVAHAEGNLSRAAEIAGVARQSLTELATKHGLHPRDPR